MKLVFAGDSITEGSPGESYIRELRGRFPGLEFVNLGTGGDTMLGITRRLAAYLDAHDDADGVFIQAGHNDIILPSFRDRSAGLRALSSYLERRGSLPADDSVLFRRYYTEQLQEILRRFPKPLRVMTLSCVNEDPASPTDGLRRIYNREIRLAAGELNIPVVDIGEAVDAVLSGKGRWYETSSMGEMVLDGIRSRIPGGTDSISGKRKLVLTIDGVHLNRRGARLYAEVISRAVEELSQH